MRRAEWINSGARPGTWPASVLAIMTLGLLVGFSPGCGDGALPPDRVRQAPPDIILVTVDALRADVLSNAGWPNATTPELDALASGGVVFPFAITSYPGTPPSMSSLMSGRYPWVGAPSAPKSRTDHGFSDFHTASGRFGVPDAVDTLAEILTRNGYLTIGFNTNPYLNSPSNFHQGFAEYVEFEPDPEAPDGIDYHALVGNYAPATVVIDSVLKRFENPLRRPVFLWIHLMDVHSPYLPPSALARAFPRTFTDRTDLEINEALYHEIYHQRGAEDAASRYPSYRDLGLTPEAFREHLVGLYEAEVRYADYELGRLFRGLRKRLFWESSVVVITADHGEELLDHGFVSHHTLSHLEDELIRIPLIVKFPNGASAGTRIDRLVRMVDIAPTLLDIVGLADQSAAMDGASVVPLLRNNDGEPRVAPILTKSFGIIRTERWKYLLDWRDPSGERERLFDLDGVPHLRDDVAASQPVVTAELRDKMAEFRRHLRNRSHPASGSLDAAQEPLLEEATRKQLEGLGYLTNGD